MRTIIAGSRECTNPLVLLAALSSCNWRPTLVVCGGARGADELGRLWAVENNIPYQMFPADWERYGNSAGYRRNVQMSYNADALIALWDGTSPGTKHMIDIARVRGIRTYVHPYKRTSKKRTLMINPK